MSVRIDYFGRFGNHAFQYACARLFAKEVGLRLISPFPSISREILQTLPEEDGSVYESPETVFTEADDVFSGKWKPGRYVLHGYFQKWWWYHERKAEVERFYRPAPVQKRGRKDILVNLRLEDYWTYNLVIHPKWYLDILAKESFDNLFIVADQPDDRYISYFKQYSPIVVKTFPANDFNFIRTFDRILCPNSTFSWWACFFSQASKIWTFKRWIGNPNAVLSDFPGAIALDGPYWSEIEGRA